MLSANIHRRHMLKGAMAMAVAKICFETKQTLRDAGERAGISAARIAYARTVLQHAPSLVDLVIREEMGLDAAYKQALVSIAFQLQARGLTHGRSPTSWGSRSEL